ncbi:TetR/AcrR family transcriptional regulator [Microbacterium sp. ARD32]|uniref:TetR/AcrR family transcriptional regulator n=1 Tax=Microbacterium sp. ARD32 TaxID=2962577 RepID=UPI002880E55E|nr:TetR/AcrR family transcriptional regulator [Microbacterium sp. ARD32]MDT0158772.1 TetR/AcrR family transcriptional regulator [Microbacterium sp. ARD32]
MSSEDGNPSARKTELLEAAYEYVLRHGLGEMSLRPLAAAIGSSPRVLLYLFGSKEGLIRMLLARARSEELEFLDRVRRAEAGGSGELVRLAEQTWAWLAADEHRALLKLWAEAYARSLVQPDGPWAGFARATVDDWLDVFANVGDAASDIDSAARSRATAVLAVLRGALLDLLATDDVERVTTAVRSQLTALADRSR